MSDADFAVSAIVIIVFIVIAGLLIEWDGARPVKKKAGK